MWIYWILASAVFLALYDLAKKASVRENAVLPVLLASTIFGSLAFTLSMTLLGRGGEMVGALTGCVLALGAVKALIVASSWVFTFTALRTLPITIATPIRSSSPALVFLFALVLYGEVPSAVRAVGMALVFAGYLTFSWAGKHEGIDFLRNRAVACALMGTVLSACSALWDKYIFQVLALPVPATQLVFQVGLVVVYALGLLLQKAFKASAAHVFQWRWTIPLVGILLAASDYLMFTGLAIPGTPVSVSSLMRRFSVAITFVLGAIFFRERNLKRKGLALALVLAGLVLLCLTPR